MLCNLVLWFICFGVIIEWVDNIVWLFDVKYYILLLEGECVGGVVDCDQWIIIFQILVVVNVYCWFYCDGLEVCLVVELLILCCELLCLFVVSVEEVVVYFNVFGKQIGFQGEVDWFVCLCYVWFGEIWIDDVIKGGLY